ncbi:MAG: hypothetical protein RR784_11945 [Burkholderiaceae bacterium]
MIDPVNVLTEAEVEPLMDGRFLWIPYGLTGKGFVVQSKEELRSLRRYDALWLVFSVLFIAGFGLLLDVWAAMALAVFAFVMRIIAVKQIGSRFTSFQS